VPPAPKPRTVDYAALRPRVPCRMMMAIDVVPNVIPSEASDRLTPR